jgi:MFS family permease
VGSAAAGGMFRSLRVPDYRVWAAGAIVSNVGTWMQRTAQDWIVLTQLTRNDAFAVGITMALQFGPQLLLLPVTGLVADRVPKRTVLAATQAVMGLLALGLGLLTVLGVVTLPEVYGFAFLLGCAAAFDAPARQSFVSELVGPGDLTNAVALNSASFNSARLVGPAAAGLLTEAVGPGWVFLINAASFAAVLVSLRFLSPAAREAGAASGGRALGDLVAGFRYVAGRRDLVVVFTMVALMGTLGMNFPIYASTMAVHFHRGASAYGLLSTALAIGAVAGALLAARRVEPRFVLLVVSGVLFGAGLVFGALAPSYAVLAVTLPVVGVAAQTFMTTANGWVQLRVERWVRGRVMAIYMAIFMGGTVVGAPAIGWIANTYGPRQGLAAGGLAGVLAAGIGAAWLARSARRSEADGRATGGAAEEGPAPG